MFGREVSPPPELSGLGEISIHVFVHCLCWPKYVYRRDMCKVGRG